MTSQILIVDDEEGIRQTLSAILEDEGHQVRSVASAGAARAALAANTFDLLLLDVWLPDTDGLDLLAEMRTGSFSGPVIVISGHGSVDTAVKAIRIGAYDFLEKPLSLSRVVLTVTNALEHERMQREIRSLASRLEGADSLVGVSDAMLQLTSQIAIIAQSDSRVVITGENGTGKELVARRIWAHSKRAAQAFVAVNCAAIPQELIESELFGHTKGAFTGAATDRQGRFQQAHRGTLFLDEIADMSLMTQAKVLRVLEEQRFEPVGSTRAVEVDVRVLAATNKDLQKEIEEGRFREDLYFRLNVIPIQVPPLRQRPTDIRPLFDHFFNHYAAELGKPPKILTEETLVRLESHSWPGNVRELRNLVERLMIMTPTQSIEPRDLPASIRGQQSARYNTVALRDFETLKEAREAFESTYIQRMLREEGGNVTQTAKRLGIERSHLHRKLKNYGIESSNFGAGSTSSTH